MFKLMVCLHECRFVSVTFWLSAEERPLPPEIFFVFRLGLADDIGGAVSFLSSDQASYITGETLVIAGGLQSRL